MLLNRITEGKSNRNVKSCIQIINNINDKIISTKNHKEKQLIACVVGSTDLVNNKLISSSSHKLKIDRRTLKKYSFIHCVTKFYQKRRNLIKTKMIIRLIYDFYLRDDVSRPTTSTKCVKTINKIQFHKRFLNHSLMNLHEKFFNENPNLNISYDYFIKQRPKFIVIPTLKDREDCLCKIYENFRLISAKLKYLNLINTIDAFSIIKSVLCLNSNKNCHYNSCENCHVDVHF